MTVYDTTLSTHYSVRVGLFEVKGARFYPGRGVILFASGGAIWSTGVTGGSPHRLTPDYGRALSPVLSADGATLFYVRALNTRVGHMGGRSWDDYALFAVTTAAGKERRVTTDNYAFLTDLELDPTGRNLFTSGVPRFGNTQVLRINAETGKATALTGHGLFSESPVCYNHGSRLLLLSDQGEEHPESVCEMSANGGTLRRLSPPLTEPGSLALLESQQLILLVDKDPRTGEWVVRQMPLEGGAPMPATILNSREVPPPK